MISAWLILSLMVAAYAWLALRHPAAMVRGGLPVLLASAAWAMFQPLGHPLPFQPPAGEHDVLGARIDEGAAIFVMLNATPEPVYYRLPYSKAVAEQLQAALDGEGKTRATVTEEGGVAFDNEAPVTGDEAKQRETPAMEVR